MKTLDPIVFNYDRCRSEVEELRGLLAANPVLEEGKDILPFFRARPQLSVFCGINNPNIVAFDRVAWEYDLFGDFSCDLAVGDSVTKAYCFLEFEDAGPRSLFVQQGQKATREWSPRFDHGCSQVIDWFYKLDDRRNSDEYEARFGKRSVDFSGVLVAGRSQDLRPDEALRLEWRRQHVVVHSKRIVCITFDELLADLLHRLGHYARASEPSGKAAGKTTKKPRGKKNP